MADDVRTPDEWLSTPAFDGVTVLDPDGWDRRNFEASWLEPITIDEMHARVSASTCIITQAAMRRLAAPPAG